MRSQTAPVPLTSPVIDYEPPPIDVSAGGCPPPSSTALHRRRTRATPPPSWGGRRPAPAVIREIPPPRAAGVFADAVLRRVLEVIDRRRPIGQLRSMLSPALLDTVAALIAARPGRTGAAVLRRVRLRTATVDDGQPTAAEVFATYTRGQRVQAIAARIERRGTDRWQLVALQIG
ncbi:Rv3235 family protein [Mycolicibacterium thermoresistibile]